MFESNIRNSMPGYTGHIPGRVEDDYAGDGSTVKKHIPGISTSLLIMHVIVGYGGYIPGVKSENVFG
jgi:hypothetical protein